MRRILLPPSSLRHPRFPFQRSAPFSNVMGGISVVQTRFAFWRPEAEAEGGEGADDDGDGDIELHRPPRPNDLLTIRCLPLASHPSLPKSACCRARTEHEVVGRGPPGKLAVGRGSERSSSALEVWQGDLLLGDWALTSGLRGSKVKFHVNFPGPCG